MVLRSPTIHSRIRLASANRSDMTTPVPKGRYRGLRAVLPVLGGRSGLGFARRIVFLRTAVGRLDVFAGKKPKDQEGGNGGYDRRGLATDADDDADCGGDPDSCSSRKAEDSGVGFHLQDGAGANEPDAGR